MPDRATDHKHPCLFCGGESGFHAGDCRLTVSCAHLWVPEPVVLLMEACRHCHARRPIESRERRIAKLLADAVKVFDGEVPDATYRDQLLQGSLEMQRRADILEARRVEAQDLLDHVPTSEVE